MRAAAMYTLIESAKMNRLDPEAYLRDVLARIADHPIIRSIASASFYPGTGSRAAEVPRPPNRASCRAASADPVVALMYP